MPWPQAQRHFRKSDAMPANASPPNPEDYDPCVAPSFVFPLFDTPLPGWLASFSGWQHYSGVKKRNKKQVWWGCTVQEYDKRGSIALMGGGLGDSSSDGSLCAAWGESLYSGNVRIFARLNQRRLMAASMGLLKNVDAMALDLNDWRPEFPEAPGKIERILMERQRQAKEFILEHTDYSALGRARKKLEKFRDDNFLFQGRDLRKDSKDSETQVLRAMGRCFKKCIQKNHMEPPSRKEVEFLAAKTCPHFAQGKNPGNISYILGHLGFGWI